MKELGFPDIEVKSTVRATRGATGPFPNVANAEDLAQLLAALHAGKLLKAPQRDLLLSFMNGAVTGLARIRGDLPKGTKVADKTGTGPKTCNDVGIVTLPGDAGHLAIVGLITDSTQPMAAQEQGIAELQAYLKKARSGGDSLATWLRRTEVEWAEVCERDPTLRRWDERPDVVEQVVLEAKYSGYIERQAEEVARFRRLEDRRIPAHFASQGHLVGTRLARDHQACTQDLRMAPHDLVHLRRRDEHRAHLGALVGAPHPALDAHIRPAARALARQHGR